jgi:hypothetical protein
MSYYDEVEIEDFEFDEEEGIYYYPCPWYPLLNSFLKWRFISDIFRIHHGRELCRSDLSFLQVKRREIKLFKFRLDGIINSTVLKVIYNVDDFIKNVEMEKEIE